VSSPDPSPRIEAIAKRLGALGCSQEQIDEVQRDQGLRLPRSYEAFLRFLGRDAFRSVQNFVGSDVGYPDALGMRAAAIDILDRYEDWKPDVEVFRLPDDAVIILMHQGYIFLFVRSSLGDDPPVELWQEGTDHPERSKVIYASIADWLEG
jgi:SMI1 / KNR4 family (SUKH-1)